VAKKEKHKNRQTLEEILQSISGIMFPAEPEKHIDINCHGYCGDTPLHVMLWNNNNHGAELLIEAGANVNTKGEMDETPLHVALRQKNTKLIKLLLQKGAKDNIKSEFDETPREMARFMDKDIQKLFQFKNL